MVCIFSHHFKIYLVYFDIKNEKTNTVNIYLNNYFFTMFYTYFIIHFVNYHVKTMIWWNKIFFLSLKKAIYFTLFTIKTYVAIMKQTWSYEGTFIYSYIIISNDDFTCCEHVVDTTQISFRSTWLITTLLYF